MTVWAHLPVFRLSRGHLRSFQQTPSGVDGPLEGFLQRQHPLLPVGQRFLRGARRNNTKQQARDYLLVRDGLRSCQWPKAPRPDTTCPREKPANTTPTPNTNDCLCAGYRKNG